MNADEVKRRLSEIAEMTFFDRDPAISALLKDCRMAEYPQSKRRLDVALKAMEKHRDADAREDVIEDATAPLLKKYFTIVIGGKFRVGSIRNSVYGVQPMRLKRVIC